MECQSSDNLTKIQSITSYIGGLTIECMLFSIVFYPPSLEECNKTGIGVGNCQIYGVVISYCFIWYSYIWATI